MFQKISGIEKFYASEGYVTIFCRNFLSHSAENLRRESLTVALISGTEKVWIKGGGVSRYSVEIFLSHTPEKVRR